MLNVGIVGIGRIACEIEDNHVKAYQGCVDTKITALCDTNISKAWDCRDKYKLDCECYERIEDMPRNLDIISICTRPESHYVNLVDVVDYLRPKAIYLEKPIATCTEEAEWMVSMCNDYKIILQINHQRRFGRPMVTFARGMENTGTHMFDMLRWYFGDIRKEGDAVITPNGITIDINEIQSAEHIFKFEVPPDPKGLIRLGVEHLVECIKQNKQSISSGEDGLEALKLCLLFKK
jgi:predicted dehydrogenase